MINSKYNPYIAKIFSSPIISELAKFGNSKSFLKIIDKSGFINRISGTDSWQNVFEKAYNYLLKNYRSEYIYKNAIANKILLGRHSLNTSTLLSELRVGNCKADIAILNGTSSVYEIKSEYDSLDRLKDQIDSYIKFFDRIYIITHESHLDKIEPHLKTDIGLILLTSNYTLKTIKIAPSNKSNTKPNVIFDSLRKPEYCKIIKEEFNYIPDVPNTRIYKESKKLFSTLTPTQAHDRMVAVLRNRNNSLSLRRFVEKVPKPLKLAALVTNLNSHQRTSFSNLLPSKFPI